MKGLLIWASTDRSASVCATSEREMMCALRIVLRAYIRCVSRFLCGSRKLSRVSEWCSHRHLHNLHDFSKTAFSNHFKELKVFNLERAVSILHKVDTNFE